ncbi:MAG: AIR synthase-related protein, partial [Phycisphaeraceae bacterium]
SGVHSNGYSLVRAIVKKKRLKLDRVYPELDAERTLGEVLLEPTRIYVKPIIEVLHKYKVKRPISAMAHITGGGLPGNLNRSLPGDLDAKLNKKSWDVPPIFGFLKKHGNVSDAEMYKVFNMGIGYTLVVRPHFADAITKQLNRAGETVYRLGEIVKGSGKVRMS